MYQQNANTILNLVFFNGQIRHVKKYMQISTCLIRYRLISIYKHKITENLQYIFFLLFMRVINW